MNTALFKERDWSGSKKRLPGGFPFGGAGYLAGNSGIAALLSWLLAICMLSLSHTAAAETFNEWIENFSEWPEAFNVPTDRSNASTLRIDTTTEKVERNIIGRRCGAGQQSINGCDYYLKMGNLFHHLIDCEIDDIEVALGQDRENFSLAVYNDRLIQRQYPGIQGGIDFYCSKSTQSPSLGKVYQFTGTGGNYVDFYVPAGLEGNNAYYHFQGEQCFAGFYNQLISKGRTLERITNLNALGQAPHIFELDCYQQKPAYSLHYSSYFFSEQANTNTVLILLGYQHHGVTHYLPVWRVDGRELLNLPSAEFEAIAEALQDKYGTGEIILLPDSEHSKIGKLWIDLCFNNDSCPANTLTLVTFSEQKPRNISKLESLTDSEIIAEKKLDRYFNQYDVVGVDAVVEEKQVNSFFFQGCSQQELNQFGITVPSARITHIEAENFIEPDAQQRIFSCQDRGRHTCAIGFGSETMDSDDLHRRISERCRSADNSLTLLFGGGVTIVDGLNFDRDFSPVQLRRKPGTNAVVNFVSGNSEAPNPGVKTIGTHLIVSDLTLNFSREIEEGVQLPAQTVIQAEQHAKIALINGNITIAGGHYDVLSVTDSDLIANGVSIAKSEDESTHARGVITQSTSKERGTATFIESLGMNGTPLLVLDYQSRANVVNAETKVDLAQPYVLSIETYGTDVENVRIGNLSVQGIPVDGGEFKLVDYTGMGRGFMSFPEQGLKFYVGEDPFALDLTIEENREKYFNCAGVGKMQLGDFFTKDCLEYPYRLFNIGRNSNFSNSSVEGGQLKLEGWEFYTAPSAKASLSQAMAGGVTVSIQNGGEGYPSVSLHQKDIELHKEQCYMLKLTARSEASRTINLAIENPETGRIHWSWGHDNGQALALTTFNKTFVGKFSLAEDDPNAALVLQVGGAKEDVTFSNIELYRLDRRDRCDEDAPAGELNQYIEPNLTVRLNSSRIPYLASREMPFFRYFNHYQGFPVNQSEGWEACEQICLNEQQCSAWTFDLGGACYLYDQDSMLGGKVYSEQSFVSGYKVECILPCEPVDYGGPAYQSWGLRTGTAQHETGDNFEFLMAANRDIIAIKKSNTGTGTTEVHILSAASNYQSWILQTGTPLHETGNNFEFLMAANRDIVAIKKSNAGTGTTEVHILSAASNYQNWILQTGTALHETGNNFEFLMAMNRDIVAIKKSGTGTGRTEVYILSAASNYQIWVLQTGTKLHETGDNYKFLMALNRDIVVVQKSNTVTGKTEVHTLSASSNYKKWTMQTRTVLGETDGNYDFLMAYNWDIVAVKKSHTDSGSTEVHFLKASPNACSETLEESSLEEWVEIPDGQANSFAAAFNIGGDGREVRVINGSPDFMTVDIWDRGQSIQHHRYEPCSGHSVTPAYGIYFDATVTRWRDCPSPNAPSCSIAGVYKFSALNDPGDYLPSSAWWIIPRP